MREGSGRKELTRRRGGLGGGEFLHERTKREQKGRLESGRKVNIESLESRFAAMEKGGRGVEGMPGGRG